MTVFENLPTLTLVSLLRRRAAERPEDTAYVFLADGEVEAARLTYAELDRQARGIGAALSALGAAGERVVLLFPPSLDFIAGFFGCLYAGALAVPAYPPRSARGLPRLRSILDDARPRVVLTTGELLERSRALLGGAADLAPLAWLAADGLGERAEEWQEPRIDGDTVAFLQYTSGSTSTPKGVMVSHANLLHNEEMIRRAFGQSADSVIVGWLPLYHDMGLIGNVLQPLYLGARCVLMSPVAFLQKPLRWLAAISRYRGTTSGGPNFAYELCERKITAEQKAELDLSSWRLAFNGAEPVRAETLERFAAAFAPCGFRREAFYPCFGLAEATLFAAGGVTGAAPAVRAVRAEPLAAGRAEPVAAGEPGGRTLVGCGGAWLGQRLEVVDPDEENGARLCAPGQVGEIWIAGPSVAQGYWGNAAATERDFRARLAGEPEAGPFLRTGDLGFVLDGELYVTGRLKDLIILRGRNLYPQDLELTAERAHPGLRAGCGAAFSVDAGGEERLVILQEIERRAGDAEPAAIAAAIRAAVAREHEVSPGEVVLLRMGTIPKTSSGKIQRHACRAAYLDGSLAVVARDAVWAEDETAAVEPDEEEAPAELTREALLALPEAGRPAALETWLRQCAARVLRVPVRRIDAGQPLVALGLDSLSAVELKSETEAALGVAVPLAGLLEGATARGLAGELLASLGEGGEAGTAAPLDAGPTAGAGASELPLSHGQRALWFLQRMAPESAAYNIAAAARLAGEIDPEALRRSFQGLVDRHPALRTTYHDHAGQPVQRVHEAMAAGFLHEEAAGLAGEALAARLRRELYRPFDLGNGPLLRVVLLRLADREHALGLAVHHIAADFWSLALLAGELGALYARETGADVGSAPPLAAPPAITYGDFVRWQADRLAGAAGERLWAWWREALPAPPPDLDLPTDRPRPAVQTDRGGVRALGLGPELSARLQALAQSSGSTLFALLLAGFQALLHRYTRQEELAVGCPAAGRGARELASVVGYFVNPVVVRGEAAGDLPFNAFLARIRRAALGALEHQEYPFALLTERLQPVRDPSRSPLFQAMFTLQKSHLPEQRALAPFALGREGAGISLGPLALAALPLGGRPAQLDLTLEMAEDADGLAAALVFNADLFDAATAERLLGGLRTLLAGVAADPARTLLDLPLLAPAEERQILVEWNATAAEYPAGSTVWELIAEQAERTPERVALVAGGESLTYRQLTARSRQLARHLIAMGIGAEVRVGVLAERSADMVVALLSVLAAGGAYVPIDPAYPADRVEHMLSDSGAPVVLTQERLRPLLAGSAARAVSLDGGDRAEIGRLPDGPLASRSGADNLAYVIYTSGSTGKPKGVQIPHRGVVNFLTSMAARPGLDAEDALVSVTTLSFDIFGLELYLPLIRGARVVLADRETAADGVALRRLLTSTAATVMQATPATWRLLLAAGWDGVPPLRVLCGGEALPRDLAERLLARGASVWNLYGPTETTIWSAVHAVAGGGGGPAVAPSGRPIANTGLYLLDAALRPVPVGVPGELLIGGDGLARGYRGRPDLTAERFVPDPVSGAAGARLYRTGDLARFRPSGEIEFLGRLDHQVKIRGYRIELGEVETALAAHPAVRQTVVVARPEPGGSHRLVAYAVFSGGGAPDVAELRRFLAARLPDPFIPSVFVGLDRLPLTPNGKVDRKALPAPEAGAPARAESAAPRSALERTIAEIWREALQVEKVGLTDNFFELGGHSLLAAEVHARLRETLGRELSMVDLFRHPTVGALARFLAPEETAAPSPFQAPFPAAGARGDAGREVAIVGMAGRFPGAPTVQEFWRRLRAGEEMITFFSDEELAAAGVDPALLADPAFVRAGGAIAGAELFDAAFFGFSPREAELMDPQHRIFLECAWHALEDAGYEAERYPGRIGLYAGVGINTYLHHAGVEQVQELAGRYQAFIGNDKDFVPTRASYKLNLRGPSVNVQTACSTSLVALHLACQALLAGDCDMALAGGVAVRAPQQTGYLYEEGGIPSPDGHCRAFDARAQGTVFGNGVGIVVLKPLARALADGDTIHAVVKGTAINNDGALKVGYTAPSVEGQAAVIAAALAAAGVEPETVSYVEAHGTGTPMGDPIEVAALAEAFSGAGRARRETPCALGSVKSNIGHLDTAAGIAGLIKTVAALEHRELPPSLHFEAPNPRIDFTNGPFRVNSRLTPWESAGPRRAGVSSFGIGGTNAHVVLEEAPPAVPSGPSREWQLLVLSARTPAALDAVAGELAAALRERPELPLADVAHTLRVGRKAFAHRRLLVCREREEAAAALAANDPERILGGTAEPGERPVAFLFSGQGSQHAGMARGLYDAEPAFRRELDRCAEILLPHLGRDLRGLLFPAAGVDAGAAARELTRTEVAQPALFAVEYALAQLWISWGVRPQAMLGHSLGEYVAACVAGVLPLADALALVAVRGRLMGALPAGGAMLGVQMAEGEVVPLLGTELSLAAVNGPAACVVSGPEGAVAALTGRLDAMGVRHRRLHTSHAFHSALMDPILDAFAAAAGRVALQAPKIPFVSNLTGTWITAAEATDPGYWVRHLRGAVRFADGVRALLAEPDRLLLEVGPGNALSTLARQSVPAGERRVILASLPHPQEEQPDPVVALRALGRLWLAGAAVDWPGFVAGEDRRRVPLPLYPFERQRYWLEPRQPAERAADRLARKADLADWFYAPLWRQGVPPAAVETADPAPWLLLGDAEGPGAPLLAGMAERLERLGRPVAVARSAAAAIDGGGSGGAFARLAPGSYTLDPGRREDWDALFAALREDDRMPRRVVHAWNLTGAGASTPQERLAGLPEARVRAFDSLLLLAQALEAAHGPEGARGTCLAVLSDGLQRVTGEAVLAPEKALLLGLVAVIPQEIPGLACRSVDLQPPVAGSVEESELIADLLAETEAAGDRAESVVAWRGGERWVRTFGPARLERESGPVPRVREGGVYLVTGGLGGVGLALAEELATAARVKLALLGRTALPPREGWAEELAAGGGTAERIRKVAALEALGAEVLTLAADVTDPAALEAALAETEERLGPVRGVVHAAGVPGGRLLQLLTPAAAAAVLAPKVSGTLALQAALGDRPLDFFVLCSSINAAVGGFGQSDYCAANAFLDAFAQAAHLRHRRRGPYTVAIGWDRWEEVGMAARSASALALWQPSAYAGTAAAPPHPVHPLLDARVEESAGREVYASEMTVERHWVLSEHRIAGHPTVPGTTYLEMARAAFARRAAGRPVEIREAVFLSPLVVLAGERREVLTVLTGEGDACDFQVSSRRGEEPWLEHARGRIAAAAAEAPARRDVAALIAACTGGEITARSARQRGEPGESEFLVTGPRWASLRRIHLGDGESVAGLELDERFAGELADYALHPALLDVAAGAVQLLGDGDYLPLTYDRLVVYAPLTRQGFSHFRLRGTPGDLLTCDITLLDAEGNVRVEIEGFSMKRVGRDAVAQLRQAAPAPAIAAIAGSAAPAGTGDGIFPAQGRQAFRRILRDGAVPCYVVSTRDLQAVAAAADAFDRSRLAGAPESAPPATHARPEVSSAYAPPADDLERRITGIWERVLGIERVGVHDNFFELGGTSLSGIQLVTELKKHLGVEVPTVSIFQAPTVSALVRYLRPPAKQKTEFEHTKSRAEKKRQAFAQTRRSTGQGRR